MGMRVDPARRHEKPVGIDLALGRTLLAADLLWAREKARGIAPVSLVHFAWIGRQEPCGVSEDRGVAPVSTGHEGQP